MEIANEGKLWYVRELRDVQRAFRDRAHAGEVLADLLGGRARAPAIVLAVPAGGVPVAERVAARLRLPLDVAVVSKMTPPWNSEVGYGAVAFDGTVEVNEPLRVRLGLTRQQTQEGVEAAARKVRRRITLLRGDRNPPELAGRTVILIDDGLASGYTLRAAARAVRGGGPRRVLVAVPTAHESSIARLIALVDAVWCANVRADLPFAVADAYRRWADVDEREAGDILRRFRAGEDEGAGP
jgi:predicted phosphoribosyltransferase